MTKTEKPAWKITQGSSGSLNHIEENFPGFLEIIQIDPKDFLSEMRAPVAVEDDAIPDYYPHAIYRPVAERPDGEEFVTDQLKRRLSDIGGGG